MLAPLGGPSPVQYKRPSVRVSAMWTKLKKMVKTPKKGSASPVRETTLDYTPTTCGRLPLHFSDTAPGPTDRPTAARLGWNTMPSTTLSASPTHQYWSSSHISSSRAMTRMRAAATAEQASDHHSPTCYRSPCSSRGSTITIRRSSKAPRVETTVRRAVHACSQTHHADSDSTDNTDHTVRNPRRIYSRLCTSNAPRTTTMTLHHPFPHSPTQSNTRPLLRCRVTSNCR